MSNKIIFIKSAPRTCYIAFSGGVDSCVLLDILIKKRINTTLLTIDHRDSVSDNEVAFALDTAKRYSIKSLIVKTQAFSGKDSKEAFWSKQRNGVFQSMDQPVLTGHHLDDALEWYLMTAMQGRSCVLKYQNNNVHRPLLLTTKAKILEYATNYKIEHIVDPTNCDNNFNLRNKVRNLLMPTILNVFPGAQSVVKKLILQNEKTIVL